MLNARAVSLQPAAGPRRIRRLGLWACTRGAIAIEAALLFPVAILLLISMMDYSFVLFTQESMQSAARDTARQLAVRAITTTTASTTAKNLLPSWVRTGATVTATQGATADGLASLMTVKVDVPAKSATPIALTVPATWTLSTSVTMRLEPAA